MVKIKMCGFMNAEDVKAARALGVDMVGAIIEIDGSSRSVTLKQAREIFDVVSDGVAKVAVIMPRSLGDIERVTRELNPDYIQVHLNFLENRLSKIRGLVAAGLIVAVTIPQKIENRRKVVNQALRVSEAADYLLLDTKGPSGGGTGITHDWTLSREIREVAGKPVFLAGGLNPSNVGEAIRLVQPYGVDVATGVESSPGRKDAKLMRKFIEVVRQVSGQHVNYFSSSNLRTFLSNER